MRVAEITPFGKAIKRKLLDMDRNQNWLIGRVVEATGLYFDGSYLYKIMTGRLTTPGVIQAICEILEIDYPDAPES